ncbi:MAG: 50S ribosomal protein L21 [Candidatus Babeliales bacterium]
MEKQVKKQSAKTASKEAFEETQEAQALPVFEAYAIIQTGGKQYQAIPGKTVGIEKLEGEAGQKVEFTEVLMRKSGDTIEIGQPFLNKAVKASIVKQTQGPKVIAFKFKRRKKSRVKKGHRQPITVVRIEEI